VTVTKSSSVLRPDERRLGPHDWLARFDADEPVEVVELD
jgi:hypothetical protein